MQSRELTANERTAIKALVTSMCANYDSGYKVCLPLDCPCFMFGKCFTGGYCKYFEKAVLPLDPMLMAALTGGAPITGEMRLCSICGKPFPALSNRAVYCADCSAKAQRRRQREYMRKKRGKK